MKKERYITINVIQDKKININKLSNFFAMKYSEEIKNRKKKDGLI